MNKLETCKHTMTETRPESKGSWCSACGIKVYAVETRECQECLQAKKLINGWICSRYHMAITPKMLVTFKISEGSCFVRIASVKEQK